jgi:hypothetical protein
MHKFLTLALLVIALAGGGAVVFSLTAAPALACTGSDCR